jgi:energy-converting hydrogenase Eha subunit F
LFLLGSGFHRHPPVHGWRRFHGWVEHIDAYFCAAIYHHDGCIPDVILGGYLISFTGGLNGRLGESVLV